MSVENIGHDLVKKVNDILFYKWDPIELARMDGPVDEYKDYATEVTKMLLNGEPPGIIAEYLHDIAANKIGVGSNFDDDLNIAAQIVRLK